MSERSRRKSRYYVPELVSIKTEQPDSPIREPSGSPEEKKVKREREELLPSLEDNIMEHKTKIETKADPDIPNPNFSDNEEWRDSFCEVSDDEDNEPEEEVVKRKTTKKRKTNTAPQFFGEIESCPIGTCWERRVDCAKDGVHRMWVAGIHGSEQHGCYSIALSGGYPEDVDSGETFLYTGEGGRDLKGTVDNPKNLRTAKQSKDQELKKGNLALVISYETQQPIRVIRGFKLKSEYAPETGYRYDGLYKVSKWWKEPGESGFLVYRFEFTYCPNQIPSWKAKPREETKKVRKYKQLKTYGTSKYNR